MSQITELKSGLLIANFSIPYDIKFSNGEILPAVSEEKAKHLSLSTSKTYTANPHTILDQGTLTDLDLRFHITAHIENEIDKWWEEFENHKVDIVIFSPLMMQAFKDKHIKKLGYSLVKNPFRCLYYVNWKDKLASPNTFLI